LKLRGEVIAAKSLPILAEAKGPITKIFVSEGDSVKAGDLLITIDSSQLKQEIEKQNLSMEKTVVTEKNAKDEFGRKTALYREHFIPETEWLEAKKVYDLAELDYSLAKQEMNALTRQLEKVNIKAPFSGVITQKNAQEGEALSVASDGTTSGKVLLILTDPSERKISSQITAAERASLKEGQTAEFWLDASGTARHKAKISKLGDAAIKAKDASIGKFNVEMEISEPNLNLSIGVSADVEITVAEAPRTLSVPIEAIFKDGESKFVYIQSKSGIQKKTITTGITGVDRVQITSGLHEGETVLLEESSQL